MRCTLSFTVPFLFLFSSISETDCLTFFLVCYVTEIDWEMKIWIVFPIQMLRKVLACSGAGLYPINNNHYVKFACSGKTGGITKIYKTWNKTGLGGSILFFHQTVSQKILSGYWLMIFNNDIPLFTKLS